MSAAHRTERADALVLFGITGDLAKKKLIPAVYRLALHDRLPDAVVGVARSGWDLDDLRRHIRTTLDESDHDVDDEVFERIARALRYVDGDYEDEDTYVRVAEAVADQQLPVFYFAIPPDLFDDVISGLVANGLHERARVVLEKPFGRDLASAQELNALLHRHFPESSIFRIDHFLGKEAVQNLMVFRFTNTLLDPVWNRYYVDNVQVTLAEDFGVEGRGRFYDGVGALRDVVQNHLLQVVALLAMEPPATDDPEALRDEIAKVLRAIRPFDPADVVRGQFEGYREEDGVEPDSDTETFVAVRAFVDSWRWAGVPWYIRAGKSMASTVTEAVVELKRPPRPMFTSTASVPEPNRLSFRMKPDDQITVAVQAKKPGEELESRPVSLVLSEAVDDGDAPGAYDRLLDDALDGDPRLFSRQDAVEAAWEAVQPVLDAPPPSELYRVGSWGPTGADRLVPGDVWNPCGEG
ncbi:glucose-6-phosphate dehydrogenase [Actinomarinicola tropica]|uniref:Glucose-6-phosphate 1-dehydrogenase n=1 Tax=Actinomarinicola tropica TaxID=2789776 RepID=A0A5Q2RIS0_9ACTN|nr:glucose-6-phosphate dehydrogenase [Actinomarinicola tropica]QGG94471.1 glucose-6-phosphate dehydrogenase [Actinomarinicola tropica]